MRLPSRSRGLWHACTIRPEFDPMHRSNGVEGIESVCVCGVEIGSWHGRLLGLVVHVYTQGCVRSVCKSSLFAARLFALSPPLPPPRPTPPPPSSTILHHPPHTHIHTFLSLSLLGFVVFLLGHVQKHRRVCVCACPCGRGSDLGMCVSVCTFGCLAFQSLTESWVLGEN